MNKLRSILLCYLALPYCAFADTNTDSNNNKGFFSSILSKIPYLSQDTGDKSEEKKTAIALIQKYSLAGDYKNAEHQLNEYKNKYGEDDQYLTEQARYFALTHQSARALDLIKPLLQKYPDNKTLVDIKNYALTHPANSADLTTPAVSAGSQSASYSKSVQFYQQAVQKDPNDKAAAIGLVRTQLLMGNYSDASASLEAYKNKFGEDDAYTTERARYYALQGDSQQALTLIEPLLQKDPANKTYLDIKNYAATHQRPAEGFNIQHIQLSPENAAAAEAMGEGDYNKAIKLYKDALKKDPADKSAAIGLVRAQLFKGKYKAAKKGLNHYKKQFGSDDQYLTEKARYYALTGQRSRALKIVNPLIEKDPSNKTLLDIKNYAETAKVAGPGKARIVSPIENATNLARKAQAKKTDPELFFNAAQAYSFAGDKHNAYAMINDALQLSPANVKYLKFKAAIASQLDYKSVAYCTYLRLYYAYPNDPEVHLGLARAAGRLGNLDESAYLYESYIGKYPNESQPWIEYAYIQSWRGNYRAAVYVLDQYRCHFAESQKYLVARARIVATADRPTESLAIINQLMPIIPDNYDLNYANTVALYYNNQPIEMFQSLAKVNQLAPGTQETQGLIDYVRTPYRSNIYLDGYHSYDTDTVKITRGTLGGQYFLSPVASLLGDISAESLSASIRSGLNPVEGGNSLELYGLNVGGNYRFNPHLLLQGLIGGQHASDGEGAFTYKGDAFVKVNDTLEFDIDLKRSFYDVSARAVSLGVKRNLNQLQVYWQPCIQCYVNLNTSYSTFSDSNTMKYLNIMPAVQVLSTQWFNLRLGVDGMWYGFSKQLNNGYYNPENYRYYSFVTDLYIKQSENIGYEFTIGLGTQKDETFVAYRKANDFAGKAYIGIYQDWYLVLSAAESTRGRAIGNNPSLSDYRAYAFDAMLMRRF